MRLIDADALLEELNNLEPRCANKYVKQGVDDGLHYYMPKILEEQPTIDAVPAVRCKDCKYCDSARDCIHPENIHHYYDGEGYDYESFHMVDPDHFCSHGERKEADGNG